ncbi:MAG: molybdopterin-binding protein, partial [Pseudobdellovibrionaceae bacterium]
MKTAALISIGTEVVTGQIVNTNLTMLAMKLDSLGINSVFHLSLPDEKQQMEEGLSWISEQINFVFITGGLGPTSDDFTREVVTNWLGLPLIYDSPSWDWINKRLTERGARVREHQKQQCYFP